MAKLFYLATMGLLALVGGVGGASLRAVVGG
jgi:hypothetical protein